jgi:hypothetical protein
MKTGERVTMFAPKGVLVGHVSNRLTEYEHG